MPPTRVVVARSPEGKVTTINVRLGQKGVPYGWEYITCLIVNVPKTNKLEAHWDSLAIGKKIRTSTTNKVRKNAFEYSKSIQLAHQHTRNLDTQRHNILKRLDIEYIRALEPPAQHDRLRAITRFKQDLRKFVADPDDFIDDTEYCAYSPAIFTYVIDDYMPLEKSKLLPTVGIFIMMASLIIPTLIILL